MRVNFIKSWRKHRGMTQVELAEKAGVSRTYLTMIERGTTRYNQDFLEAVADALDATPADLIAGDPDKGESIDRLLRAVELTDSERARVVRVVKALLAPEN